MNLRKYQRDIVNQVATATTHDCIQLDTGAGKTAIMATLAKDRPSICIAHRNVLIEQIALALAQCGLPHGIIGARHTVARCALRQRQVLGRELVDMRNHHPAKHLILLCAMRQALQFFRAAEQAGDWKYGFDFVLDMVQPRKSPTKHMPNNIHVTGLYFRRGKSGFDRTRHPRSDVFGERGYWPSILRAPRERMDESGYAKPVQTITDIIGAFDVQSVLDPFAGSGTTGLACLELNLDCTLIELDAALVEQMRQNFKFFGVTTT